MDSLPYRATIFMRPVGLPCGRIDMMERSFAKEADAVFWCKVRTEAEPNATGVWTVSECRGGRMLTIIREENFALANHFDLPVVPAAFGALLGPSDDAPGKLGLVHSA